MTTQTMTKEEWQAQASKLNDSDFFAAYAMAILNFQNKERALNPSITNEEIIKKISHAQA
jgi:hypothetical protein